MKIVSVESSVVSLPFDMGGPYATFAGTLWDKLEILLVRVETEDGLVGWGEAFGHAAIPATRAALDSIVAPLVLGRDATDIAGLSREILHATHLLGRNGSFVYAFSGIEIALWDLMGKRAGMPLYQLLGGSRRESLQAYSSLLAYGSAELAARNTLAAANRGYRYIKLHETTREALLASQHAVQGRGIPVMLDVNCAWDVATAMAHARSMSGDGMYWLEEPVWPPEDVHGLAQVRALGIPIAAGENVAGVFGFKALIEAGAIDIAQPSVTKLGGIGEAMKVVALCQANGVEVVPHCPYFGPGFIATMHIAATLAKTPLIEVLWMDMEANPFDPWVTPQDGMLRIPQGPGLGCDPDPEIMARYLLDAPHRITKKEHA
jgi:L-alanine-DL-glutamate epimerase-like enolase superfamily enzyme